jgi:hypothetical protein
LESTADTIDEWRSVIPVKSRAKHAEVYDLCHKIRKDEDGYQQVPMTMHDKDNV